MNQNLGKKGPTTLHRMADFVMNVLALTVAFALLGSTATSFIRLLMGSTFQGGVLESALLVVTAAIVFVVIRDHTTIL